LYFGCSHYTLKLLKDAWFYYISIIMPIYFKCFYSCFIYTHIYTYIERYMHIHVYMWRERNGMHCQDQNLVICLSDLPLGHFSSQCYWFSVIRPINRRRMKGSSFWISHPAYQVVIALHSLLVASLQIVYIQTRLPCKCFELRFPMVLFLHCLHLYVLPLVILHHFWFIGDSLIIFLGICNFILFYKYVFLCNFMRLLERQ
jgi:hypothetical protein